MTQTYRYSLGQLILVRSPPEAEIAHRGLQCEETVEVCIGYQVLNLFGGVPRGGQGTNEGSHACPCDFIDRDAMLMEPHENTDVSDSESSSSFQGESNPRPGIHRRLRRITADAQ
ncbi:MAG: hypothetical protein ABSA39_23705 [Edaphobacter sp.]